MGGVRLAAAAAAAAVAGRVARGPRARVQGGRADDHQTGLAVRPGAVRARRRPGAGDGQREVPGPPRHPSQEGREQVR